MWLVQNRKGKLLRHSSVKNTQSPHCGINSPFTTKYFKISADLKTMCLKGTLGCWNKDFWGSANLKLYVHLERIAQK